MQIFIGNNIITLSSLDSPTSSSTLRPTFHTFALDVPENSTILQVKRLIQLKTQLPPSSIRLTYSSKILSDDKTLASYFITKESTLTVLPNLRGGTSRNPRELRSQRRDRRLELVARLRAAHKRVDQLTRQVDHVNEQVTQTRLNDDALATQMARMQRTMIWTREQEEALDLARNRISRTRETLRGLLKQQQEVCAALVQAEAAVETCEAAIEDLDDEVRSYV